MSRNEGVPISRKISCRQASAFETTLSHSPPSVRMVAKSTASVPIFGPIGRSRLSAECAKLALDPPTCPFRVIARAPIARKAKRQFHQTKHVSSLPYCILQVKSHGCNISSSLCISTKDGTGQEMSRLK